MKWNIFLILIYFPLTGFSQELFPLTESANTLPKNVFAVRAYSDGNYEIKTLKVMGGLRLMYGIHSKLSVYLSASMSNHHSKFLPPDLVSHGHPSGGSPFYFTNRVARGVVYPMRWNGFHFMAKYRLLSFDQQNKHYRVAIISDLSNVRQAHDEAEPNLYHDNRGWGIGIINSFLYHRLAISSSIQGIFPWDYSEEQLDVRTQQLVKRIMKYGNAAKMSVSFGYLLQGNKENSFDEPNTNIYLEFLASAWQAAQFVYNGQTIPTLNPAFNEGYYVEIHPGIQRVIRSNLRLELSVGIPLVHKSFVHFYPIYSIAVQRYLY
ncbi:MAG: hypothetical protein IPH93_01240 [Saprospiraceae bacterium]|nr:hypothetical protein [Saprospiraceae bacterium]MBK7810129.1 hypothetical protein [Saprospiraceae bacterium]MBK9629734.1 hypothetical protein [Saprospiraceae bacterium]